MQCAMFVSVFIFVLHYHINHFRLFTVYSSRTIFTFPFRVGTCLSLKNDGAIPTPILSTEKSNDGETGKCKVTAY